ncbi:MAG TPA: hypothetical protein EYQ50_20890 [Verrucomicrobiales bacterium]|nr:hypothetical protein [Verrucomicrobiales bacterium]HIL68325.1 hypothetical protein [Verrucomicrobiota bacterium]
MEIIHHLLKTWLLLNLLLIHPGLHAEQGFPLQGDALLKTDMMLVLAHPDDETGMATTLAYYSLAMNKRITIVYLTRGEGGGNMVGRHWGPSLGLLRERELRNCLSDLGIDQIHFLNQRDWAYTESAQMTLEVWDSASSLEHLVRLFRATRPDVVLTMNPIPSPGQHGHHQAAAILGMEAFTQSADEEAFPLQMRDEGLEPWQGKKLYMTASPEPFGATIPSDQSLPNSTTAVHTAGKALSHHRSQGFGRIADSPWLARPKSYRLLKSSVGFEKSETDLFRGISEKQNIAEATITSAPMPTTEKTELPKFRFESRPAMERFMDWSLKQGMPDLASSLIAGLSVPAGEVSTLLLLNESKVQLDQSSLTFKCPTGWTFKTLPPKENGAIPIRIQVPSSAREKAAFKATLRSNGKTHHADIILNPRPGAKIPSSQESPSLRHASNDGWASAQVLSIPHTNNWQGEAENSKDSSATARVLYTRNNLWIRVDVKDDRIVRNIAPNDIRGHWRSDSVEICIDPLWGSEHTLNTFKVGIFPFDTEGKVRAARDADANQGPIERTAPGMRLSSGLISGGYRITTAIPWKLISIQPQAGLHAGFNILIYDGDKENAAMGENINECRLAWSPGKGVQGRPEDWGRITLGENSN